MIVTCCAPVQRLKLAGLTSQKHWKGWQLVDPVTGTQVAASWADDSGLTLDQIDAAMRA